MDVATWNGACVVDQHIDLADLLKQRLSGARQAQVGFNDFRCDVMRCFDSLQCMRQIGLVARDQNGHGTFCCKRLGNGQANAFRAARDQDALPC